MAKLRALTVDRVFTAHAIVSGLAGLLALLIPNVFEFLLLPHGERFALRDNANAMNVVEHLTLRYFGALLLGSAWIAWSARANPDARARRALVQAFALVFALTLLSALRAQLAAGSPMAARNWFNIFGLAALTAGYCYYSFVEPLKTFDGIGKGLL